MSVLDSIKSPACLKALDPAEASALAGELRREIIADVAAHGGHLAASLGAVEICIALLRVFDPPRDKVVFDVGHQAYAWKILTGRREAMAAALREEGGPGGFPNPDESPCDAFVAGHAGVALAVAQGFAAAGADCPVAVVGDASLANGGSLEALNNVAPDRKFILLLNDNKMSIGRNRGAIARFLGRMLSAPRYNRVKSAAERTGHRLHLTFLRRFYHGLERRLKSLWLGNAFFERLGMRYIGPIEGHDVRAVENALRAARADKYPCVVHVVTQKGKGFPPAEKHPELWHGVGRFDVSNPRPPAPRRDWSAVFGEAVCGLARADRRVAALTAAMRDGTGLSGFAGEFPGRFFDGGIAEASLVSFAGGLAAGGMRPVVAIYSTFLQRAVDGVFHDVCLQNLPVVFAVDRAGAVGADGRTHHGVFDIPMLRAIPSLSILSPASAPELGMMLDAAVARGGPVAIRWPRGTPPPDGSVPAPDPVEWGRAQIVREPEGRARAWIWALGDSVSDALEAAALLEARGFAAGVVNARFAKPVDSKLLLAQAAEGAAFATVENGSAAGGFGSAVCEALAETGARVKRFGWPDEFIPHGSQDFLKDRYGLSPRKIADSVFAAFAEGKTA